MSYKEIFDKYDDDEYLKFDRVKDKKSNRPDLHAFLVLDNIFPGDRNIIDYAEDEIIFITIDAEDVQKIDEMTIIDLLRCGVRYDDGYLTMFA